MGALEPFFRATTLQAPDLDAEVHCVDKWLAAFSQGELQHPDFKLNAL